MAEPLRVLGAASPEPLLVVRDLTKTFVTRRDLLGRPRERLTAVDAVSFELAAGRTLGLVGESGSGKSTTGRLIARLVEPDAGTVVLGGRDVTAAGREALRELRRDVQMVFQDPYSSLDPSWIVADVIAEPLRYHSGLGRRERHRRAAELLDQVGLDRRAAMRYPYEFSGGQRQRLAIARALALNPRLIICDEAVSALDVSTQASIITLLEDLQRELGVSYLFISHDLAVVRHVSHHVAVMRRGAIVETGDADRVWSAPREDYTRALLDAVPRVARRV
ncbi:peptide/nickel transport system ATP-binding protein [Geodermatophilus amargosae]|uniref:Peptide/nickel transport system ATP-binding protein n=1 Tax=Geodermatophilus amargosae TaxID=1296565 RepID=A0A1I6XZ54_9ACTN|nr:ATP-binding cassette domain-containing protein [Geodermatophilus amargosae]SFT43655.1 peptide/nickel transport system ATP-binding protein [Geodermatophilus amargosae]